MTAIAIITTDTGVVVACDGGLYGPDGTLLGIGNKILLLPEASAAIVGRGSHVANVLLKSMVAQTLERLTFDALAEGLPTALRSIADQVVATGHASTQRFSFYLVGWSEGAAAFRALAFRSYPIGEAEAFEALVLPECYLAPEPPQAIADAFGMTMPSSGGTHWRIDPGAYAAMSVEAVRFCEGRYVGDASDVPDRVLSAGFVQLTRIGRLSVSSEIVREWPDEIGKLVDMKAGYEVPDPCSEGVEGSSRE